MVDSISPSICLSTVIWHVEKHSPFGELEAIPKYFTYVMLENSKIWMNCMYLFVNVIIGFFFFLLLFKIFFILILKFISLYLFSLFLNKGFHSVSELGFFPFYHQFSEVSDLTFKVWKCLIKKLNWEWGSFCYRIPITL